MIFIDPFSPHTLPLLSYSSYPKKLYLSSAVSIPFSIDPLGFSFVSHPRSHRPIAWRATVSFFPPFACAEPGAKGATRSEHSCAPTSIRTALRSPPFGKFRPPGEKEENNK